MSYQGIIFDVDGVLVDSPHETAWRNTLQELMETDWLDIQPETSYLPERFTTAVYQEYVAGKPRLSGARSALEYFGMPQLERHAREYAELKQDKLIELVEGGEFQAFPDALRFILAVEGMGIPVGAASSSKNANLFLHKVRLDTFAEEQGLQYDFIRPRMTLLRLFDANVCGRDFPKGKPHPEIFLTAAEELGIVPEACVVVEDAASGIQAAKAGGMAALGVARLNDEALLEEAGADLVVATLDDVSLEALKEGRLERKRTRQ